MVARPTMLSEEEPMLVEHLIRETLERGADDCHNVSTEYRTKEFVGEFNKHRKIHLLTLTGVFQLILNNKSTECRRIKEYLAT